MNDSRISGRLALLDGLPASSLLIHEIYRSLQGESRFAGLPCVFIRLAVCDARCVWCDTPHAFGQGETRTLDEVVSTALCDRTPLVEVTGGEPLLQPAVFPLMTRLADAGRTVLLETSGAHDVGPVDPRVHIVMDVKCPASGEAAHNRFQNFEALKPTDEVKFVVANEADWRWADALIRERNLDRRFGVLVSPAFGDVLLVDLARWILDSRLNVRMQVQLHKLIWGAETRSV
jgi:7-carboxy-7-deazaguanine synthase